MWLPLVLLPSSAFSDDPPGGGPEASAAATPGEAPAATPGDPASVPVAPAPAAPAPRVTETNARVDHFADGWITVVAPGAGVKVDLTHGWTVDAAWASDIISGATPHITTDAVSSATRFTEARHGLTLGIDRAPSTDWSVHGSYSGSAESDFVSHSAGVGMKADAFGRMVTFSADYHARFETVGRADDAAYAAPANVHTLDLGGRTILGRSTTATLLATGEFESCAEALGCDASPYRKVRLEDGLSLSERHPGVRGRVAAAARVSQAFGVATAMHAGYRYYLDTWEVTGHTVQLSLVRSFFDDHLTVRANGRYARQSAASFWGPGYASASEWRTGDLDLGGLTSGQGGLSVEGSLYGLGPASRASLSAHVDRLWLRHDVFPDETSRDGWLLGGGIDAIF